MPNITTTAADVKYSSLHPNQWQLVVWAHSTHNLPPMRLELPVYIGMQEKFRRWRKRHEGNELSQAFRTESKKGGKASEDVNT